MSAYGAKRRTVRNLARMQTREHFAATHGLVYSDADSLDLGALPLAVLTVGAGHTCERIVSGNWKGIEVFAWDLNFWFFFARATLGGSSLFAKAFELSCAMVRLPRECPRTIITPRGRGARFGRRAARQFHLHHVDSPRLIKDWRIHCEDTGFGNRVATGPLQHRLAVSGTLGAEIALDALVVYSAPDDPRGIGHLLDTVLAFRSELLPAIEGADVPRDGE